jgi:linoleate 10R-lipoxygenase
MFSLAERGTSRSAADSYIHAGRPHACLGKEAGRVSITAMMKVVGRMDNLRRAPGPQGQLKKIPDREAYIYMKPDHSSYWPFPTSKCSLHRLGGHCSRPCRLVPITDTRGFTLAMKINWDGEPSLKKL